jgi:hypothetical protein
MTLLIERRNVRKGYQFLIIIVLPVFLNGLYDARPEVKAYCSWPAVAAAIITAAQTTGVQSPSAAGNKLTNKNVVKQKKTARTTRWCLTFQEMEKKGIYSAIESYLYRMCLQEVPLFLALHKCFYKDLRLAKGDTLVLKKPVMQTLLLNVASHLGTGDLNISPVTNIDSMVLFRNKRQKPSSTNCNVVIFAHADAYDIPKTGAKIDLPAVTRGAIACNPATGRVLVAIFSKGVRLELPAYAKILSLGILTDMDIGYAELVPSESAFEARLLYATNEKEVKRRGWSLNITECNKIRPYAK